MSAKQVVPYLSVACRIGTHNECTEGHRVASTQGVPVLYERCRCTCHKASPDGQRGGRALR